MRGWGRVVCVFVDAVFGEVFAPIGRYRTEIWAVTRPFAAFVDGHRATSKI